MNYAWIQNSRAANIIWLEPGNAADFPNAVPLEDRPVRIGDSYLGGVFMRDGVPVLSPLQEALAIIAALDAEVIELTYQQIILGLGL